MARRSGNQIFNTVRRFANGVYQESKYLDPVVLQNTYGGDVEAYLLALYPTMDSQQASDLENTQTVQNLTACPTCEVRVSALPTADITAQRALAVGAFWPDNNPTIWLSEDRGETWTRQYRDTNKTNVVVTGVSFPSGNVAYACLTDGTVLKSSDKGETWSGLTLPTIASWASCDFTTEFTGYVVGEGKILKTTDGGVSWTQFTNPSTLTDFTKVYCVDNDDQEVYIVGDTFLILKSEDGGLTWADYSLQSANPLADTITDISMESSEVGYFVVNSGGGPVFETTDYGVTWHAVAVPGGGGWSIHAPTKNTSYAGHSPYTITKTTTSWSTATITPGNTAFYPNAIKSPWNSSVTMIVVGEAINQNNFIHKTTNAFTSKYAVASESNNAGNGQDADFAIYSTDTALYYALSGVPATATVELYNSSNVLVDTDANQFNGLGSFTSVPQGDYTLKVIDNQTPTCNYTSPTFSYSFVYGCMTAGVSSQLNSDTTTDVYWVVSTSDGGNVSSPITVNATVLPSTPLVFNILAGNNSAVDIQTYARPAFGSGSDTKIMVLNSGTGYTICQPSSAPVTIPEQVLYTLDNFPGDYANQNTWATMRFFYIGSASSSLSTGFEAFQITPALNASHRLYMVFDYVASTPQSGTFTNLEIGALIDGSQLHARSDYVQFSGSIPGNLATGSLEVELHSGEELQYFLDYNNLGGSGAQELNVSLTWNKYASSIRDNLGNIISNTINGTLDNVCSAPQPGNCGYGSFP